MPKTPNSLTDEVEHLNNYILINLHQSPEHRKAKYWLVRSFNINNYQARRMRDWRLSKIERFLGIEETYNPHTHTYDRDTSQLHQNASQCRVEV